MLFRKLNTPWENYMQIIKFFRATCRLYGLDLLDVNFRVNWRTKIMIVGIISYFLLVFLTIYNIYSKDWTIVLRAPVTLGSAIQGFFKLLSFILNHDNIVYIMQIIDTSYLKYQIMGSKYCNALNKINAMTKKAFYTMTILYGIGYSGMIAVAYVLYAFNGGQNLIIEFHVPFLDINTYFGYFATLAFQTIVTIVFGTALYCGDVGAMIILTQGFMFSRIFKIKIECVNEMIEDAENCNKDHVTEALKDIIQWHQLYIE